MRGFTGTQHHKLAHARRVKMLELVGWRPCGRDWISPYSGLRFDEINAISIEDMRGTFRPGYAKDWGIL